MGRAIAGVLAQVAVLVGAAVAWHEVAPEVPVGAISATQVSTAIVGAFLLVFCGAAWTVSVRYRRAAELRVAELVTCVRVAQTKVGELFIQRFAR
jgi:hypothetical protein